MSNKKSNLISPCILGQPGAAGELPDGPKIPTRLTSEDLRTFKFIVRDKIYEICGQWGVSVGRPGRDDEAAMTIASGDSWGKLLVASYRRLCDMIPEALVVDIELLGLEETPKLAAALRLILQDRLWFGNMGLKNEDDLYFFLRERSYRYCKKAKTWVKFNSTCALDVIRKDEAS